MTQKPALKPRDPVPTSYAYSALFFAGVGVFASAGTILVAIAGMFAFWRLYISKSLNRISIDGMGLVWATVVIYYGAGALSAIINPSDDESVAQLVERLPLLFLPMLLQFFSQADPYRLLVWSVKGAAIGIFASFSYWGVVNHFSFNRFAQLSGNANIYGYMSSLLFVFLCIGVWVLKDKKAKFVNMVALVLSVILISASGSRASFLAVVMTTVVFVWCIWPWRTIRSRLIAIALLIAFTTPFLNFTTVGQRSLAYLVSAVQSGYDLSRFDPERVAIWSCGVEIGAEKPLMGRGHDEALDAMKSCTYASFGRSLRFSHFHNLFVDQFAKGGGIGLISASLLWLLPILLLIRSRNFNGLPPGLIAGVLGMWSVQSTGAFFNIGFGHDAIDAGFVYANALLFGVMNTYSKLETVVATDKNYNQEADVPMVKEHYMKAFSLGGGFTLALAAIAFFGLANTIGFNRFTIASGGFALPAEEVEQARNAALELRDFVNRVEVELAKDNSSIVLPDTEHFHAVASVWHEEYKKLTFNSRNLHNILVRKEDRNYKILLSGPVCPIAVSSGLFQSDPKRKSTYNTLCSYFAVWKGEGRDY